MFNKDVKVPLPGVELVGTSSSNSGGSGDDGGSGDGSCGGICSGLPLGIWQG